MNILPLSFVQRSGFKMSQANLEDVGEHLMSSGQLDGQALFQMLIEHLFHTMIECLIFLSFMFVE